MIIKPIIIIEIINPKFLEVSGSKGSVGSVGSDLVVGLFGLVVASRDGVEPFDVGEDQVIELVHLTLVGHEGCVEGVVRFALPHRLEACLRRYQLLYRCFKSAVESVELICL